MTIIIHVIILNNLTSTNQSSNLDRKPLPVSFLTKVSQIPNCAISRSETELYRHGKGESYHPSVPPQIVLSPSSIEAVSSIVTLCVNYNVNIIPFGAGTSLEGHVAALDGGVCIDLMGLNKIEIMDDQQHQPSMDFCVKCGPGVTRKQLNQALRHTGMQFMVDPGADASIGGMVSTRASGTTTVQYGTMRDNILALEAIFPTSKDGEVVKLGSLARKSSAGYDLVGLLCGSEGTLGIITSITLKLHPIPASTSSAVCSFDDIHNAANAVSALQQMGILPTRCELLDSTSIHAFIQYSKTKKQFQNGNNIKMPVKPHLFLEFSGPSDVFVREQVSLAQSLLTEDFQAIDFEVTSDETLRNQLWAARHELYYASLALRPGSNGAIISDVCVPFSQLSQIFAETVKDVEESNIIGPCFGHAGDGNFHCILPTIEDDSPEYMEKLLGVNERIVERAIAVGGTCTGEHGIGYGKIKYLNLQYGDGTLDIMRQIKKALDPKNIMNPGKIV